MPLQELLCIIVSWLYDPPSQRSEKFLKKFLSLDFLALFYLMWTIFIDFLVLVCILFEVLAFVLYSFLPVGFA